MNQNLQRETGSAPQQSRPERQEPKHNNIPMLHPNQHAERRQSSMAISGLYQHQQPGRAVDKALNTDRQMASSHDRSSLHQQSHTLLSNTKDAQMTNTQDARPSHAHVSLGSEAHKQTMLAQQAHLYASNSGPTHHLGSQQQLWSQQQNGRPQIHQQQPTPAQSNAYIAGVSQAPGLGTSLLGHQQSQRQQQQRPRAQAGQMTDITTASASLLQLFHDLQAAADWPAHESQINNNPHSNDFNQKSNQSRFQSKAQLSGIAGAASPFRNQLLQQLAGKDGQDGDKKGEPRSKESRHSRSRRSKHSKESESRAHGRTASPQRFQQHRPRRESKNETGAPLNGDERVPSHVSRGRQVKAHQSALSNFAHQQDLINQSQNRLAQEVISYMLKNKGRNGDHTALLWHNHNLNGLQEILSKLKEPAGPLDGLVVLTKLLRQTAKNNEDPNSIESDLEAQLIKKYLPSIENLTAQNQSFGVERSPENRCGGRPETSAVAAAGTPPRRKQTHRQDANHVHGQERNPSGHASPQNILNGTSEDRTSTIRHELNSQNLKKLVTQTAHADVGPSEMSLRANNSDKDDSDSKTNIIAESRANNKTLQSFTLADSVKIDKQIIDGPPQHSPNIQYNFGDCVQQRQAEQDALRQDKAFGEHRYAQDLAKKLESGHQAVEEMKDAGPGHLLTAEETGPVTQLINNQLFDQIRDQDKFNENQIYDQLSSPDHLNNKNINQLIMQTYGADQKVDNDKMSNADTLEKLRQRLTANPQSGHPGISNGQLIQTGAQQDGSNIATQIHNQLTVQIQMLAERLAAIEEMKRLSGNAEKNYVTAQNDEKAAKDGAIVTPNEDQMKGTLQDAAGLAQAGAEAMGLKQPGQANLDVQNWKQNLYQKQARNLATELEVDQATDQQQLKDEMKAKELTTGQDKLQVLQYGQAINAKAANDAQFLERSQLLQLSQQNYGKIQNAAKQSTEIDRKSKQTQNFEQAMMDTNRHLKVQNEVKPKDEQQKPTESKPVSQQDKNGSEFIKQLILKSKELNGIAQVLGIKDVEQQLHNLIADLKETSQTVSGSGLGSGGSINNINGTSSGSGGSGQSAASGSGCDSGQKYKETGQNNEQRANNIENNENKISTDSGISGQDNEVDANKLNQQVEKADGRPGSGSGHASKANTADTNAPNVATLPQKYDRPNGLGINKLHEFIANYKIPPGNNQTSDKILPAPEQNNSHLLRSNIVQDILQGQMNNQKTNVAPLNGHLNAAAEAKLEASNAVANTESANMGAMRYSGPTSGSEEGDKKLLSRNGQMTSSKSQSHGQSNRGNAEQQNAYLADQLKNQEKEISKLKAFILLQNAQNSQQTGANGILNAAGSDSSKFTQQILMDCVKQLLNGTATTGTGSLATDNTNLNHQDFSTHEPAAMPAQPLPTGFNIPAMPPKSDAYLKQLLQQNQRVEQEIISALQPQQQQQVNASNATQQQQMASIPLLGKRTLEEYQQPDKTLLQFLQKDIKNGALTDAEDERMKSRPQFQVGTEQLLQQAQLMQPAVVDSVTSAQQLQQYQQPRPYQQIEQIQKFVSKNEQQAQQMARASTAERQKCYSLQRPNEQQQSKGSLLTNLMKMKKANQADRSSEHGTTFHQQGLDESSDHQYEGTSSFLRLKAQIKKNMNITQFLQQKAEIMNTVNKHPPDTTLIGEKPKRPHHNMGEDSFRGSRFRGVSKNKCKWQMMIMINQKKVYIGAIQSEIEAAKYYDHIAILTQGLNSKTNFAYTGAQLARIVKDYDFTNDSYAFADIPSQIASSFNSKQNTRQMLQEGHFDEYSQSNYSLAKRQRREEKLHEKSWKENGALVEQSSDENAMISNHIFNEQQLAKQSSLLSNVPQAAQAEGLLAQKTQQASLDPFPLLQQGFNNQKNQQMQSQQNSITSIQNYLQTNQGRLQPQAQAPPVPGPPGSQNPQSLLSSLMNLRKYVNQGNLNAQNQGALLQQLLGVSNVAQATKPAQPPLVVESRQPGVAATQGGQPALREVASRPLLRPYMAPPKKDVNPAATYQIVQQRPITEIARYDNTVQNQSNYLGNQQNPNQLFGQQKFVIGISSDSWRQIQNHARVQPQLAQDANNGHQLANQHALQATDEPAREQMSRLQQQHLGPNSTVINMNQTVIRADETIKTQNKMVHPAQAPVVAAAHDPFTTPPSKAEERY